MMKMIVSVNKGKRMMTMTRMMKRMAVKMAKIINKMMALPQARTLKRTKKPTSVGK